MGHKTHPLGFRLGITRPHLTTWFTKFQTYANLVEEDDQIRSLTFDNFPNGEIAKIGIRRNSNTKLIQLLIHTARPADVVGKNGTKISILKTKLEKKISENSKIHIGLVRIENPNNDAQLIANDAVKELENRAPFRKVLKQSIEKIAMNKGGKFQISGRLGGAEIARNEWAKHNRIPLQTLRADIDYATASAHTVYGVIGIKIWLFKSELISRPILIEEKIT